jgi:hypothetical protein
MKGLPIPKRVNRAHLVLPKDKHEVHAPRRKFVMPASFNSKDKTQVDQLKSFINRSGSGEINVDSVEAKDLNPVYSQPSKKRMLNEADVAVNPVTKKLKSDTPLVSKPIVLDPLNSRLPSNGIGPKKALECEAVKTASKDQNLGISRIIEPVRNEVVEELDNDDLIATKGEKLTEIQSFKIQGDDGDLSRSIVGDEYLQSIECANSNMDFEYQSEEEGEVSEPELIELEPSARPTTSSFTATLTRNRESESEEGEISDMYQSIASLPKPPLVKRVKSNDNRAQFSVVLQPMSSATSQPQQSQMVTQWIPAQYGYAPQQYAQQHFQGYHPQQFAPQFYPYQAPVYPQAPQMCQPNPYMQHFQHPNGASIPQPNVFANPPTFFASQPPQFSQHQPTFQQPQFPAGAPPMQPFPQFMPGMASPMQPPFAATQGGAPPFNPAQFMNNQGQLDPNAMLQMAQMLVTLAQQQQASSQGKGPN